MTRASRFLGAQRCGMFFAVVALAVAGPGCAAEEDVDEEAAVEEDDLAAIHEERKSDRISTIPATDTVN